MEDVIVGMLNALSSGGWGTTDALLLRPQDYNTALYDAAIAIHNTAVKPITSLVLSIIAVLMLARQAAHMEGDRELGIKIIASVMFRIVIVLVVAQNAVLLLDGINGAAIAIANTANGVDVGTPTTATGATLLGDQLRDQIVSAGMIGQIGMLVVLLLPWMLTAVVAVIAIVLVFIRFLQIYMLTAFASLPLAFFGHEDTKGIGIGYIKRYAVTLLQGVVIIIAVKFYEAMMGNWIANNVSYDGTVDLWPFLLENFGNFLVGPIVLAYLLFSANGIAKAVIGEG